MTGPVRDRGFDAQRAAEAHLDACDEAQDAEEIEDGADLDDDDVIAPEVTTAGPYCACRTCEVRETLAIAWPHVLAHAADLIEQADVAPYTGAVELLRAEARRMTLAGQEPPA